MSESTTVAGEHDEATVTPSADAPTATDTATADGAATETAVEADASPAPADERERVSRLEREGDVAADFLEELLDIADLDGDIDLDVEGDRALVAIVGDGVSHLVGPGGKVLDALQDLTRLAVHQETGERSRLVLDVDDYRAHKREALTVRAQEAAARVKESGEPVALEPMTPFERKVVHDAVAAAGLTSSSDGVEPNRHVVVSPA